MTLPAYARNVDLAAILSGSVEDEHLESARSQLYSAANRHDAAFAAGVAFAEMRSRCPWLTGWSGAESVRDAARLALQSTGRSVKCDHELHAIDADVVATIAATLDDDGIEAERERAADSLNELALAANAATGSDISALAFLRDELAFLVGAAIGIARLVGVPESEAVGAAVGVAGREFSEDLAAALRAA